MLAPNSLQRLHALGINATHPQDFVSGLKLMQLVSEVFYQGENKALASKMRLSQEQKTGINVLNVNIILNHLKKDPNIQLAPQIRDLTAFKIIQQDEAMIQLIQWILSNHKQPLNKTNVQQQMSPPRQQENQFENLFFVSSLDKQERMLNDSLQQQNPQQRVVRKGSFKVLKPKTTASKQSVDQNAREDSCSSERRHESATPKQPLKQRIQLHPNITSDNEDKDNLHCRKTIPKMYEKPPLYRSKQKQKSNQKKEDKNEPTPETTRRLINREEILQNIANISRQIVEEEKSLSLIPEPTRSEQPTRKPSRKIFKLDIPEVEQAKKKVLVSWLISINLLSASSIKFVGQLQNICKDGVVFIEVINYYRGRGKEMCYFKEPKRTAELHSNYQKLFSFLNQQVDFKSELLHQYEYFIPEAHPNAFWNMLASIYDCFNRRVQPRHTNIHRYDQAISNRLDKQTSRKKDSLNESISYQEIKYNSASLKKETKSNHSSVEAPRKTTPVPKRESTQHSQQPLERPVAPYGLVQKEEPSDDNVFRTERGYKQMYLCKFKNLETPQKCKSFHNSSLSKSRLRQSMGSSKKKEGKPVIPSINLQMQMKVLKYLEEFQIGEQNQQLFKDIYRNGVLIGLVVKQTLGIECIISRRPKSIDDCRNNFISAIDTVKSHKQNFNSAYEGLVEELVKGQRTLLYGLIWQALKEEEKECNPFNASLQLYNKTSSDEGGYLNWIRSVERTYPDIGHYKIRNEDCLFTAITCTDFLFRYSWFITGKKAVTPTYERPINDIQKQSNLKKVLGYLVQSKIIRSDYLWKAKALCKEESTLLRELVTDLANHFSHLYNKEQTKTVNFVKYLRRQDSESKEKHKEKLETTMANQTTLQPPAMAQQEPPKLQVNWMRKLGFTGNLQLNNGVVLCRLMAKLNMKTIQGFNEHPQSKAECLGNIRKAIKNIPKFRWDEYDILQCDYKRALEIYGFIRDRYKHAYAMKGV